MAFLAAKNANVAGGAELEKFLEHVGHGVDVNFNLTCASRVDANAQVLTPGAPRMAAKWLGKAQSYRMHGEPFFEMLQLGRLRDFAARNRLVEI